MTVGVKLLAPKFKPWTVMTVPPLLPRLETSVEPSACRPRYDTAGASKVNTEFSYCSVSPRPIPACCGAPAPGRAKPLSDVLEVQEAVPQSILVANASAAFCR